MASTVAAARLSALHLRHHVALTAVAQFTFSARATTLTSGATLLVLACTYLVMGGSPD